MKRFIVEQCGFVQVEAGRKFIVEVPDDFTEEQIEELLEDVPDEEGMEWYDVPERNWIGYDVVVEDTEVYDPEIADDAPRVEGLKIITLEVPEYQDE